MKDNLSVKKYIIYFFLYSIVGWLYEVINDGLTYYWGHSNRGSLTGPYCVIYGFGALIFIFVLNKAMKKKIYIKKVNITPLFIFIFCGLIATIVELIGSYIMQLITGSWMWDYTMFNPNFQGRIALNPSLRFAIGGTIFLYLFQPLFEITNKTPDKILKVIDIIIIIILLVDVIYTFFIK